MRLYSTKLLYVALILVLTVGCGQPGNIGLAEVPVGLLSTSDGQPVDLPPGVIEKYIQNCRDYQAAGKLQVKRQTVRFDDTKQESGRNDVCEFSSDEDKENSKGNLSELNEYLRARYTQNRNIPMPANAVICDIGIESQEQNFNYDDVFFLSLNNYVLASNHKKQLSEVLSPEFVTHTRINRNVSLYKYDWLKLRNTIFKNEANDFCLGSDEGLSNCQWPVTQEYGKIKLKFDPELLIRVGSKAMSNQQAMSFVITGDNDNDSDCYHQQLDLDLEIKYYVP